MMFVASRDCKTNKNRIVGSNDNDDKLYLPFLAKFSLNYIKKEAADYLG